MAVLWLAAASLGKTQVRYAPRLTPRSRQVPAIEWIIAAHQPDLGLPRKSPLREPTGVGREVRSTGFWSMLMWPRPALA